MSNDFSGTYFRRAAANAALDTELVDATNLRSEEIFIEADESESEAPPSGRNAPQLRFLLSNRAHAQLTEITLFERGWLSVRHHRRGAPGMAQMINLRFVDPQPALARRTASKALQLFLGLLGLTIVSATLAFVSVLTSVTAIIAAVAAIATVLTFGVYVFRTQERAVFCTTHGRAPVIRLLATLGCFRVYRELIPRLGTAIQSAHKLNRVDKNAQLREEMREHYRLKEAGVISADLCTVSTKKLLNEFD
jgi:hypothetical protein